MLHESPFNLGARSILHFMDPKNFWPSKWSVLVMKDPLVFFATMLAICDGSPNWFICHHYNSSLSRPSPHLPPFKYIVYHVQCTLFESMNIIIKSCNIKTFALFPKIYNQILWIVSNRLQLDMSTSSYRLNFWKHLKKKTN